MSGQTPYYRQHNSTGEIFVWAPAQGAFIGCDTREAISQGSPGYAQLVAVTPRFLASQPATSSGSAGPSAILYTPSSSGQSYTYNRDQRVAQSNDPARRTTGQAVPQRSSLPLQSQVPTAPSAYAQQQLQYGAGDVSANMANLSLGTFPHDRRPSGSAANTGQTGVPPNTTYVERSQPAQYSDAGRAVTSGPSAAQSTNASIDTERVVTERREHYEPLDTRYKQRSHRFYKPGRVFMVPWSEPASNDTAVSSVSVIQDPPEEFSRHPRFESKRIHSKIRRFIVVRSGDNYSNCVRITTYYGRGVAKAGIKQSEHAIAYIGKSPPKLLEAEIAARAGNALRPAVRIDPDERGDKLDVESRIDYGRVYTVEHNLWARAVGIVHKSSEQDFAYSFRAVHHQSGSHAQGSDAGMMSNDPGSSSRRSQVANPAAQAQPYPQQPQPGLGMTLQPSVSYSPYQQHPSNPPRPSYQQQHQPQRARVSESHYRNPSYPTRPQENVSEDEYDDD